MYTLFFLALIFGAEPRPIIIIHNQNLHSKMLVGDLTRDWQEKIQNDTTKRLAEIQSSLKQKVKFVDINSLDSNVLQYSVIEKYPAIIYGNYSKTAYHLPEEAFMMSSFPMLSLEAFINKDAFDYNVYQAQCLESETDVTHKYEEWLKKNKPEIFTEFTHGLYWDEEDYGTPPYLILISKYNNVKGFPLYKPIYPLRPRIWYPWEKKFILEESRERIYQVQIEN